MCVKNAAVNGIWVKNDVILICSFFFASGQFVALIRATVNGFSTTNYEQKVRKDEGVAGRKCLEAGCLGMCL